MEGIPAQGDDSTRTCVFHSLGLYKLWQRIAVLVGKVHRGLYKDKLATAFDGDNQKGTGLIRHMLGNYQSTDVLAQEQQLNNILTDAINVVSSCTARHHLDTMEGWLASSVKNVLGGTKHRAKRQD